MEIRPELPTVNVGAPVDSEAVLAAGASTVADEVDGAASVFAGSEVEVLVSTTAEVLELSAVVAVAAEVVCSGCFCSTCVVAAVVTVVAGAVDVAALVVAGCSVVAVSFALQLQPSASGRAVVSAVDAVSVPVLVLVDVSVVVVDFLGVSEGAVAAFVIVLVCDAAAETFSRSAFAFFSLRMSSEPQILLTRPVDDGPGSGTAVLDMVSLSA